MQFLTWGNVCKCDLFDAFQEDVPNPAVFSVGHTARQTIQGSCSRCSVKAPGYRQFRLHTPRLWRESLLMWPTIASNLPHERMHSPLSTFHIFFISKLKTKLIINLVFDWCLLINNQLINTMGWWWARRGAAGRKCRVCSSIKLYVNCLIHNIVVHKQSYSNELSNNIGSTRYKLKQDRRPQQSQSKIHLRRDVDKNESSINLIQP